jgi:hypothetical protein
MKNKIPFLIMMLILSSLPVISQKSSEPRDEFTLLTMPYNQRPLSLYKGQLEVNAGYKFAVRSRTYDSNGDLILLKDEGTASVYHYYLLELKYGITDFLELTAETYYSKHGIRSVTTEYYSLSDNITVNTLSTIKGMGDLLLYGTLRLPIDFKWVDFGIRGGMYLPTADNKTSQPTNTVTNITAANTFTVNYQFNEKNGYGVPVYLLSSDLKFTFSKISLETDFTFKDPVKEGQNIRWDQSLTANKTFTYSNNSYQYLLSRSFEINAALHFQATGWFNIKLSSDFMKSSGGWTEYYGSKYKNPETNLFVLEPGCEIQVSPALTIYEVTGFPLAGKNMDGPFYLFITASINMFPFFK